LSRVPLGTSHRVGWSPGFRCPGCALPPKPPEAPGPCVSMGQSSVAVGVSAGHAVPLTKCRLHSTGAGPRRTWASGPALRDSRKSSRSAQTGVTAEIVAFRGERRNSMSAIAAAILSDGRTQVWSIEGDQILSRWKETTDPSSGWTNWSPFNSPNNIPVAISAAPLEDKRLQLYLIDGQNQVWSAWKTSTNPSAPWTEWSRFS
jgi:hypothetical protein